MLHQTNAVIARYAKVMIAKIGGGPAVFAAEPPYNVSAGL
jgi:hypothetical protein